MAALVGRVGYWLKLSSGVLYKIFSEGKELAQVVCTREILDSDVFVEGRGLTYLAAE